MMRAQTRLLFITTFLLLFRVAISDNATESSSLQNSQPDLQSDSTPAIDGQNDSVKLQEESVSEEAELDSEPEAPIKPAPAPIEPAPATIESVPAPTEPAPSPAPIESAPAPIESAPAPIEPASAPIESAPAPIEPAPAPIEPAPTPTPIESTPAPIEPAPKPIEPAPATIESAPAPIESAPAPIEPAPAPIEPAPKPIEPAPATIESAPAPIESTPAPIEPAPAPIELAQAPIEPASASIVSAPAPAPMEPKSAPAPIESAPTPIEPAPAFAPIELAPVPAPVEPASASIKLAPAAIETTPAPIEPAPEPTPVKEKVNFFAQSVKECEQLERALPGPIFNMTIERILKTISSQNCSDYLTDIKLKSVMNKSIRNQVMEVSSVPLDLTQIITSSNPHITCKLANGNEISDEPKIKFTLKFELEPIAHKMRSSWRKYPKLRDENTPFEMFGGARDGSKCENFNLESGYFYLKLKSMKAKLVANVTIVKIDDQTYAASQKYGGKIEITDFRIEKLQLDHYISLENSTKQRKSGDDYAIVTPTVSIMHDNNNHQRRNDWLLQMYGNWIRHEQSRQLSQIIGKPLASRLNSCFVN